MSARLHESAWGQVKMGVRRRVATVTANRIQRLVKEEVTRSGRVRTGAMRDSVYVRPSVSAGEKTTYRVGSDLDYFTYQNEGFGPVQAKSAKALTIKLPNGQTILRKRTTKPVSPGHFLQKAANRAFFSGWRPTP